MRPLEQGEVLEGSFKNKTLFTSVPGLVVRKLEAVVVPFLELQRYLFLYKIRWGVHHDWWMPRHEAIIMAAEGLKLMAATEVAVEFIELCGMLSFRI